MSREVMQQAQRVIEAWDVYLDTGFDDNVERAVEKLRAELAKPEESDYERLLGELLARIHRDGGHYVVEHGWAKAVQDADEKDVNWIHKPDDKAQPVEQEETRPHWSGTMEGSGIAAWDESQVDDLVRKINMWKQAFWHERGKFQAETLRASRLTAQQPVEDDEAGPIRDGWQISIANEHSGFGVYAHMTEYPEEGALFLCAAPQPPAEQHPDTDRCIKARNDLNAAIHGGGAVIDDLERIVMLACRRLRQPAEQCAELSDERIVSIVREAVGWTPHFWSKDEPLGHFYAGAKTKSSVKELLVIARAIIAADRAARGGAA